MSKTLSLVIVALLAGCSSPASPESRARGDLAPTRAQQQDEAQHRDQDQPQVHARNTEAQREQDRREATRGEQPTAGDQPNEQSDLRIAREVRQRVVGHDELSMGAKNCTIVSEDGVVTLRGEVDSERERSLIGELAQGVDGVRRVNDQLTVDFD